MIIKKYFLDILRWGLRFHSAIHLIELISAIYENAFMTAGIAFVGGSIEVLASFFIPNEHVHLKPIKSDVHAHCEEEDD